jgi:type IV pilus assembly protein PilC
MVRVGEESGRLPEVLRDLAGMLRWQDELVAYAKRVMVYPFIVLGVVGAVIVFLMLYLVPKLTSFLETMGGALPMHTRALIAASHFFVHWWWLMAVILVLTPAVIRYLARNSPRFRYQWDDFKLRIWLFGDLSYKIRLARFSNYFALMYSSGITVLEALRLSRALMDNVVLERGIERVQEQISEGERISDAFANAGLFPPLVVRMMRVGETSGALDEALQNVSYFYSREVREAVERLQPAIQPVLTVFLGGLVAWIMLSVIGPIYDTITTLDF